MRSCEKRSIPLEKIEKLVTDVEKELRDLSTGEVPSTEIGELVMTKLQELDQVAYVRFASVYRQFADVSSFLEALHTIAIPMSKRQNGKE